MTKGMITKAVVRGRSAERVMHELATAKADPEKYKQFQEACVFGKQIQDN